MRKYRQKVVIEMGIVFPARCRKNVSILTDRLCADAETVYRMMLMTAA